ncbi:GH32 C-terminal domain-containing protein [Rhodopirellula sp. JC639]|uniref:GH32 C-terminal domain-containing protein n=1 Tax=Stieleria mannarensis TaxID=2755585 RepID=UPI001603C4EA|nr:GH32 C-terminal domain-containing protein [Rhodopirellula sp. JC639]
MAILKSNWNNALAAMLVLAVGCSKAETEANPRPEDILDNAIAVWHLRTLDDATKVNSSLTAHGETGLGNRLERGDLEESLSRGGDGFVAQLSGGWFDAGSGSGRELDLKGDQFTALIRLKCDAPSLWSTRGFFTKGGGHDQLIFNFFSHDFDQGPDAMRIGCEIGIDGLSGLGGQVSAPVRQIGPTEWHDYLVRYDGNELVLFIDGVAMQRTPVSGRLRQGNIQPMCLATGSANDVPFACWIDHAAVWDRALDDADVRTLSGGTAQVLKMQRRFDAWVAPPPRPPISELTKRARELESVKLSDPHRPRYHLMHFEGGDIMPGDPNGAIYWNGRYHLFYIFQRHRSEAQPPVHCWGHASSIDLVHWEHHPTALDVAPTDPDRGIYSGNALVGRDGIPILVYHGVGIGNCSATALDDELIRWRKSEFNPLVAIPAKDDPAYGKFDSWDPHVWLENDTYYAIFGGNPQTGAPPALFRGGELEDLNYVGPFLPGDRWSQPDEDVSCPDFFSIGPRDMPRHLLLCISHLRGARYFLGSWNEDRFLPESHGRMNWPGGCFFALETLLDNHGRRILWGWCLDQRPRSMRSASAGTGVMSLPRVLTLDAAGRLQIDPVEELIRLRINPVSIAKLALESDSEKPLPQISGDSLEIQVEFPADIRGRVGIKVRRSPGDAEATLILYDPLDASLTIDVSKSSLDPAIRYQSWCLVRPSDPDDADRSVTRQTAPLSLDPGEPLRLHIFVDRSMLEVFANHRQCMTQRIWPTRADAKGVSLVNEGSTAVDVTVKAWEMAASNRN